MSLVEFRTSESGKFSRFCKCKCTQAIFKYTYDLVCAMLHRYAPQHTFHDITTSLVRAACQIYTHRTPATFPEDKCLFCQGTDLFEPVVCQGGKEEDTCSFCMFDKQEMSEVDEFSKALHTFLLNHYHMAMPLKLTAPKMPRYKVQNVEGNYRPTTGDEVIYDLKNIVSFIILKQFKPYTFNS